MIGIGANRYGVGDSEKLYLPLKEILKRFHELGGKVIDAAPSYKRVRKQYSVTL